MADLAELSFSINSQPLTDGKDALEGFAGAGEATAERVARATDAINESVQQPKRATDALTASTEGVGAAFGALSENNLLDDTVSQLSQIGSEGGQAAAAASELAVGMRSIGSQGGAAQEAATGLAGQLGGLLIKFGGVALLANFAGEMIGKFVTNLFNQPTAMELVEDALESLGSSVSTYSGLVKDAISDTSDLAEKFGSAAGEAREVYRILAENQSMSLGLESSAMIDMLDDPLNMQSAQRYRGGNTARAMDHFDLDDTLASAHAVTAAVIAASEAMQGATDLESELAASQDMMLAYERAADANGVRTASEIEYLDSLGNTVLALREKAALDAELASAAITNAATNEDAATSGLVAATDQLAATGAVVEALEAADPTALASEVETGLASMIVSTIAASGEMARATDSIIADLLATGPQAGAAGREIGVQIMDGLSAGISSRAARVRGQVTGLADAVAGEFRTALDIHSPSRVFEGYGEDIVEGLVIGIEETEGAAAQAMANLADQMDQTFAGGIHNMVSYMMDGFQDGLSGIYDIFTGTLQKMISYAAQNRITMNFADGGAWAGAVGSWGGTSGILGGMSSVLGEWAVVDLVRPYQRH